MLGALKKLKDLYDSHSELETIQLLMKLLNVQLKNDDPMSLAFEFKPIYHDIESIGAKDDIELTTFIKALYPTYSHYLESLQDIGQMKAMILDSLVEKIVQKERMFSEEKTMSMHKHFALLRKERYQIPNLKRKILELEVMA